MKKIIPILILCLLLAGCEIDTTNIPNEPSKSKAYMAVEDEGYTDIVEGSSIWLGCSDDDSVFESKEITAKNSNGKQVTLKVCCGLIFKGCTVRH